MINRPGVEVLEIVSEAGAVVALPALFVAVHVYVPADAREAPPFKKRVEDVEPETFPPSESGIPSRNH